ncbi:hypothetical protein ACGF3G_06100 [Streptomyces sp. NPDC048179]|uniref:hypothetical protein n=1 Tax=Streptomyces sp. NPDC048179 TaxID=3365506 RepID=UPI00370FBB46
MLSSLSQAAGKALGGARFTLVSVLPVTVLTAYVTVLVLSGAYSGGRVDALALADRAKDHPGWLAFGAFGCLLAGLLLRPFQVTLVQMLEGYWWGGALPETAAAIATERHRRRMHTADTVRAAEVLEEPGTAFTDAVAHARRKRRTDREAARALRLFLRYPNAANPVPDAVGDHADRLMPTMLGNILRDGEDDSGRRYGLDLPTISHRLYPQLSDKLGAAVNQQLDLLDSTCALSVSFALATVAGVPLVGRLDPWSLAPVTTALLSVAAYRGAMRVAAGHASLLAAAVDLHRFDMLAALHLKLPDDPAEEYARNRQLTRFFATARPLAKEDLDGITYDHSHSGTASQGPVSPGQGDDAA